MIRLFKRSKPVSGRRIDLDKEYRAAHLDEVPVTEMTEEEFHVYEMAKLNRISEHLDRLIEADIRADQHIKEN